MISPGLFLMATKVETVVKESPSVLDPKAAFISN
jgi:hypothetical protein